MIPAIRQYYNTTYNTSQYTSLVESIKEQYPGKLDFRIAETPLFIPKAFERQMMETCNYILSVIQDTSFISKTEQAIPSGYRQEQDEAIRLGGLCTTGRSRFWSGSTSYGPQE